MIDSCVSRLSAINDKTVASSANHLPPNSFSDYSAVFRSPDTWWFMFFYFVTFGGFSGLGSSLSIYFNSEFGLRPVMAGYATAACVFAGSLVRPIGGAL